MTFTPEEKRLLARLRKRHDQWHTERWILLAVGLIGVLGGVGTMWRVFLAASKAPETAALTCAMLLPSCYMLLLLGAWAFRRVVFTWNGDPIIVLLLKLIAETDEDVG